LIVIILTKQSDDEILSTGDFVEGVPSPTNPSTLNGVAPPPHPDVINDTISKLPQSAKTQTS
jgi:hypothetical protein